MLGNPKPVRVQLINVHILNTCFEFRDIRKTGILYNSYVRF